MTRLQLEVAATDGAARTGRVHTARGSYPVPAFMPVGTRGAVKALDSVDLEALGADVVLANTYHLILRPGADVVAGLGGLHRFTGWEGHTLTDSGGYQVHSLRPLGRRRRAHLQLDLRRRHRATDPRISGRGPGSDRGRHPDGARRVRHPARHSRGAADRSRTDGGVGRAGPPASPRPRAPSGRPSAVRDRPGWHRSGPPRTRVRSGPSGSTSTVTASGACQWASRVRPCSRRWPPPCPTFPTTGPRYLMGVGDPVGLIEAVALGVDQFDCVAPTRMARHGSILTGDGRLNLRNARLCHR